MKQRVRRDFWQAMAFLAPNCCGFLAFTVWPVAFSLGASLTNWNLENTASTHWVAGKNYSTLAHDSQFWLYIANTVYFLLGMPVAIAGSLWLAVLLNQKLRGMTAFRTLLYLPSFTSGVAIMILWKALYNPDFGPINSAIDGIAHLIGAGAHFKPPQWLLSTHNIVGLPVERVGFDKAQLGIGARDALTYMGIWTGIGGGNMLLYLAALTQVPQELIEAAELDGAGKWQAFRFVTWPQLAPTTFFIVVMSLIGGLQGGFEQARVMTGGGPAGTTTTIAYYIYTKAFGELQIGYASAVAWVLFAFVFVVTALQWRFGNRETTYA